MEMLLHYPDGTAADAVLLSAGMQTMRAALPGRSDTVELCEVDGQWFDEDGIAIEIGALTTDGDADVNRIFARVSRASRLAAG